MTLEELKIVISASTEPLRKEMENVKKQLNGLTSETSKATSGILGSFKKLLVGVIALKIGQKIGEAIVGGIKEAMNVEAAIQQIKRIMGESSNQFLKWADTQAIAFNMSKSEAVRYGSIFGNLISGFSSSTGQITSRTEDLLKASSVIASATGRTMEDVMERIRSGLLGNTEAIEDLGVNVNVAMIQSTEAFKKFANGKSWNQLDFQTQQQIRLMAILEQTTKKYGDSVNQNTSTQLAQLVAQLNNVKLSLGQAFLPIVQIVLPLLTQLASGMAYVMNIFAQFTQALFGKSTGSSQAKDTQAQANAMSNLGNSAEKAGKQAKGALAGFDEINQLQLDSSSGTGASGVTSNVGNQNDQNSGPDTNSIPAKIQEMANKIREAFAGIDFQPLINSFENLKTAVSPIMEKVGASLMWLMTNVLAPLSKWTIEDALPAFFNLLAAAFSVLNPVLQVFEDMGKWLWDNFLQPIASWTGGVIVDVLNNLAGALKTLGDWIASNKEIVIAAITGIGAGLATYKIATEAATIATAAWNIIAGIAEGVTTALSIAMAVLTSPITLIVAAVALLVAGFVYFYQTNESFRGVVDGILTTIKDVAVDLWNNVLVPLGNFLKDVFVGAWDAVKTAAEWLWKNVLVPIGGFLLWFWNNVLVPVGGILKDVLGVAFKTVADIAKSFWDNVLVPLADFFKAIFSPAVEAISTVFTFLWNNVLEPVGKFVAETFKSNWDTLITVLEYLWNNVMSPLVNFLSGVFTTAFDTTFKSIGEIIGGVKTTIVGILKFITDIFKGDWQKAWDDLKDIFKGVWDTFESIAKAPINGIIEMINFMIKKLNGIKISVPEVDIPLVGKAGGFTIGFPQIPEIPKLARGGIVDSPTLAMIGEAGKEAVVPLENTSFVDRLAGAVGTAVLSAMQFNASGQSNPSTGDIYMQLDGATFARIIEPYLYAEGQRIGNRVVIKAT